MNALESKTDLWSRTQDLVRESYFHSINMLEGLGHLAEVDWNSGAYIISSFDSGHRDDLSLCFDARDHKKRKGETTLMRAWKSSKA